MNIPSLATDNITELLVKIIEFTETRQQVLNANINNMDRPGFIPQDLAVDEFCDSLNTAVNEHARTKRLVLCDTDNIKFGVAGSFKVKSTIDKYAKKVLVKNADDYLELQVNKFMENSLNQKIAKELLRQKQGIDSLFQ